MNALAPAIRDLRTRLAKVPRVPLGSLPTPLTEAPRLADLIGVRRLFVKRDDLTGLGLGGNKVRTLEYTVADALASGVDLLVGAAYVHSNHCRQLAAAGARLGVDVRLILRRQQDVAIQWQGNLLLDELFGAAVEFIDAPDIDALLAHARLRVAELGADGRRPMLLTLAARSRLFGAIGAMSTLLEIEEQLRDAGQTRCLVYVASGGPTYTGLLVAARIIGLDAEIRGISNQFDAVTHGATLTGLMAELEALLEIAVPDGGPSVDIDDRFLGPGYGMPSEGSVAGIVTAARLEGLVLDPIYTGKGMAGLLAHAGEGRLDPDDVVVFHHTGGIPAIFSFAAQLHGQDANSIGQVASVPG